MIPRSSFLLVLLLFATVATAQQPQATLSAEEVAKRNRIEKELESIAIIDRKVMVPMKDGKRMAADVYRPRDTSKKYPIIFVRTPYN
ncbi:MAG: acylase, partial [Acidobacteria bacterium]|nr:acylase [Acidobacteriota bacterium]